MKNTARKHTQAKRSGHYSSNGRNKLKKLYSRPANDLKLRTRVLTHNVEKYTAKKPLKTLGMVTAASVLSGFVLGYISKKR